jgi:hypothetical protein
MTKFAYRSFWLFTVIVLVALAILASVGHSTRVLAAGPTAKTTLSLQILPGPLTATIDAVSLSDETNNGTYTVATYQMHISVIDATGSGNGWNLALAATLPQHATAMLTHVRVACMPGSTCSIPQNNLSYPIIISANNADSVSFLTAAAQSGMGAFSITSTIALSFPTGTNVHAFTSPLTLMIGSELV